MVDLADIPDFTNRPGQHPTPGAAPATTPVAVVLVTCPLDAEGLYTPINQAAVDAFIATEIGGGRAYSTTAARWSPWSSLQLPFPLGVASSYNYGRFTLPDGSKWYGYLSADYLNPTTSVFSVIPDDCTTYPYTIGYSTWRFGHVAVAASQGDTYGTQYCDAPEPIELTPEYGSLLADLADTNLANMKAIVVSTNTLGAVPFLVSPLQDRITQGAHPYSDPVISGTLPAQTTPDPEIWWVNGLGVYFTPSTSGATVKAIDGVQQSGGVWVFTMGGLRRYLSIMSNAPWVLQGIAKIMFVPEWAVDGGGDSTEPASVAELNDPSSPLWAEAAGIASAGGSANVTINTENQTVLSGWRETILTNYGATAYRKLVTSAAGCQVVLTDGTSRLEMKPEAWLSSGLEIALVPDVYQGTIHAIPVGYGGLIGGELGLTISFGGTSTAMQHGIGLAHQGGQGSRQFAPYQFFRGLFAAIINAEITNDTSLTITGLNASVQAASGMIGAASGIASGNPTSAIAGGLTGGLSTSMQSGNTVQVGGMTAASAFQQFRLGMTATMNQTLPQFAFQNADARATSGQGGGSEVSGSWRAKNGGHMARVVIMVPTAGRIKTLLSQWNRRGYAIDRAFVPPRLDPMDRRSFWQGEDVIVLGSVPADAKARIAARFERGTTVVTAVAEVGQQTPNGPRVGISY